MTSSPTQGSQGVFKVSATSPATTAMVQIKTCGIQTKGGTYDVTYMTGLTAPAWKLFLAGLLEATFKVTGNYDFANDTAQSTLWGLLGQTAYISFSPNTGTNKFSCQAIITSVPLNFDVSKEETVEFDFQVTGAVTYA